MAKTLVAYFSATGITKNIAELQLKQIFIRLSLQFHILRQILTRWI